MYAFVLFLFLAKVAYGLSLGTSKGHVQIRNSGTDLKNVSSLPNPFTFQDGAAVSTVADWSRRADELKRLFQTYELGSKPDKPAVFDAQLNGTTLSITTGLTQTTAVTWNVSISYPTNSTGPGPYAVMIAYDGLSIPLDADIATITLTNDDIAQQTDQSSRGVGIFYDIYGKNATAGATMAWAWATSRIMDALELIDIAESNIDVKRVGITGCSRNGKGALIGGAFEPRIALTIPQESGSGGSATWRISDAMSAAGVVTQTAQEIIQENVWFGEAFDQFVNDTALLPFDHHLLAALVAPRPILVLDNNGYEWLGPLSSYGGMSAAKTVWDSLGATSAFGFSLAASHPHCQFPADQQGVKLSSFLQRYLLDNTAVTTSVFDSATNGTDGNFTYNASDWITWTTPVLQ